MGQWRLVGRTDRAGSWGAWDSGLRGVNTSLNRSESHSVGRGREQEYRTHDEISGFDKFLAEACEWLDGGGGFTG